MIKKLTDFVGLNQVTVNHPIVCRASGVAMEKLSFKKNDPHVLAMTDAGYSIVGRETTEIKAEWKKVWK